MTFSYPQLMFLANGQSGSNWIPKEIFQIKHDMTPASGQRGTWTSYLQF